ncbi:MAG: AAA family ATPase [Oscillospiraceae bacterium]|nr:AAA family ATPase [Oscillospiraceae bacterium]
MEELFLRGAKFPEEEQERLGYAFSLSALKGLDRVDFSAPVTFFAGENGAGKSTLLEALAVALGLNPEGGSLNYLFSTRGTHSSLGEHLRLIRGSRRPRSGFFLRAESFYNVATKLEEYDGGLGDLLEQYGGSLHKKSHGESFLALVQNRFKTGIYLLDEPEAALSPTRQLALLCEMERLVKNGSQLIVATHSPLLMAFPGAEILWLDENGVTPKQWRETENYLVTRRFLTDPERMLRELGIGEGLEKTEELW